MSKHGWISISLTCIIFLIATFFVSQTIALTNYYKNDFESTSALDDGYWSSYGAEIQTINNSNVLKVTGEASFMPENGNYALDNFTVQFDVWHNIVYPNSTAYIGPFYEATDSNNTAVVFLGYEGGLDSERLGFIYFRSGPSWALTHYDFSLENSAEWSTWSLTVTGTNTEGSYFANITLKINDKTISSFRDDFGRTLTNITNQPIFNPVSYHNLLPLTEFGVVPAYTSTENWENCINYDLINNIQAKPMQSNSGATPSYIDNFYYGYADTVPSSIVPTSTPIVPELSWLTISLVLVSILAITTILRRSKYRTNLFKVYKFGLGSLPYIREGSSAQQQNRHYFCPSLLNIKYSCTAVLK